MRPKFVSRHNMPVAEPVAPSPTPAPAPKASAPPRKSIFDTAKSGGKDGLVSCSLCGRNFAPDRIEKHESICAKTKTKKRKVFDVTKMRVKGTEAESYVLPPPTTLSRNHPAPNRKPISIGQHILQQQHQAAASAAPATSAKSLVCHHLHMG